MSEREHSNTLKYSKLFVENKQIMEHSKLLMVPDHQDYLFVYVTNLFSLFILGC